jgi:hypothetical protein
MLEGLTTTVLSLIPHACGSLSELPNVHESPAERKSLPQKSIPPRLSRGERSTREMSSKATGLAAAKLVNNQSGLRDVAVATASSLESVFKFLLKLAFKDVLIVFLFRAVSLLEGLPPQLYSSRSGLLVECAYSILSDTCNMGKLVRRQQR